MRALFSLSAFISVATIVKFYCPRKFISTQCLHLCPGDAFLSIYHETELIPVTISYSLRVLNLPGPSETRNCCNVKATRHLGYIFLKNNTRRSNKSRLFTSINRSLWNSTAIQFSTGKRSYRSVFLAKVCRSFARRKKEKKENHKFQKVNFRRVTSVFFQSTESIEQLTFLNYYFRLLLLFNLLTRRRYYL